MIELYHFYGALMTSNFSWSLKKNNSDKSKVRDNSIFSVDLKSWKQLFAMLEQFNSDD